MIIDPPDVDDLLQKGGHVWRALSPPPQEPKVIVYLATSSAKKALEIAEQSANGGSGNKGRSKKTSNTGNLKRLSSQGAYHKGNAGGGSRKT